MTGYLQHQRTICGHVNNVGAQDSRFFRWSSDYGVVSATAGADVDGVGTPSGNPFDAFLAVPGQIAEVEAGGTISSGDDLTPDSSGRAVVATSGDVIVGRALESASSGNVFQFVFVAGRDTA